MFVNAVTTMADDLSASLSLGQSSLLGDWLATYLSGCYEHEVASLLASLERLVSQARRALVRNGWLALQIWIVQDYCRRSRSTVKLL